MDNYVSAMGFLPRSLIGVSSDSVLRLTDQSMGECKLASSECVWFLCMWLLSCFLLARKHLETTRYWNMAEGAGTRVARESPGVVDVRCACAMEFITAKVGAFQFPARPGTHRSTTAE